MLIEIAVCVWLLNLETAPGILSSEHSIALQCYSSLFIFSPSLLHIWLSFKSTFTGTTENCSRDAMRKSMLPPPQLKEGKGFRWQPTTWSPSFTWEWSEIKGCKSQCMHPTADRVSFHLPWSSGTWRWVLIVYFILLWSLLTWHATPQRPHTWMKTCAIRIH